ncbi:MAG TPA: RNA-binding S4 domain-containing protein [Vicinamibacteria bacterium]|nr:RNA-binding S4 domain-containing protein [Vicinamibacteria bacterium]
MAPNASKTATDAKEGTRLDLWLDVACLFKTRSEAQRACRGGKVNVNGRAARPNRVVGPGDEIVITRSGGRRQQLVVRGTADRHIPKAEARALYEDRTPPPTPEELEIRQFERAFRAATPPSAPHRRDRRLLRRLKGQTD